MRQDDPLALRDIVQLVQSKVADKNPRELGYAASISIGMFIPSPAYT